MYSGVLFKILNGAHCNLENIIILSINTIVLIVIGFAIANPVKIIKE